jgi:hypothetical protein
LGVLTFVFIITLLPKQVNIAYRPNHKGLPKAESRLPKNTL